jgi:adenosylmethionine---8-amino-7-oxononanoate aminotransferase
MSSTTVIRDRNAIWHPFTPLIGSGDPLVVKSGKGVYLYTEDGRAIIDGISSWWVNLHGHGNSYIAKAVAEQAAQLEHVIFAGFTHEPAIALAEQLLRLLPENQSKIFYSDNGSTAVEVALKMAFQFWHNKNEVKTRVIAIDGAYHGDTFGAMSVGDRGAFTAPFAPFLFQVDFIDFPSKEKEEVVLAQFETLIEEGEVAAFIFEPLVQGSAGMRMYSKEVLDKMILMAQRKQIICIADEVMTGFGRTGKMFACDYLKNTPDIFCLSKGLTGGTMAMGVTSCTEEIIEVYRTSDLLKTFFHGHSFTANPIACASALASLQLLVQKECFENIQRIMYQHTIFLERMKGCKGVKDIRSLGTILAIELASFGDTSYFNEARHKLYPFFLERNILLRPLGNVVYILPPYIISDAELDKIYEAIEELLEVQ